MNAVVTTGLAHSAAPFDLESFAPGRHPDAPHGRHGGHILKDRLGESIALLAFETAAHPPMEQLADALLFRASPALLQAAKAALPLLARDLKEILECNCGNGADYQPKVETLPPGAQPRVRELVGAMEQLVAAILLAEGG